MSDRAVSVHICVQCLTGLRTITWNRWRDATGLRCSSVSQAACAHCQSSAADLKEAGASVLAATGCPISQSHVAAVVHSSLLHDTVNDCATTSLTASACMRYVSQPLSDEPDARLRNAALVPDAFGGSGTDLDDVQVIMHHVNMCSTAAPVVSVLGCRSVKLIGDSASRALRSFNSHVQHLGLFETSGATSSRPLTHASVESIRTRPAAGSTLRTRRFANAANRRCTESVFAEF